MLNSSMTITAHGCRDFDVPRTRRFHENDEQAGDKIAEHALHGQADADAGDTHHGHHGRDVTPTVPFTTRNTTMSSQISR